MSVLAEFFGGPWDGELRELDEAPWQLRVQVPGVVWVGSDAPAPLGLARELVYRLVPRRLGSSASSPLRYALEQAAR